MRKFEGLYRITLNCSQCHANNGQQRVEYARKIFPIGQVITVGCKDCKESVQVRAPNHIYGWNEAQKGSLSAHISIL